MRAVNLEEEGREKKTHGEKFDWTSTTPPQKKKKTDMDLGHGDSDSSCDRRRRREDREFQNKKQIRK